MATPSSHSEPLSLSSNFEDGSRRNASSIALQFSLTLNDAETLLHADVDGNFSLRAAAPEASG
jgi:hypothetical protein